MDFRDTPPPRPDAGPNPVPAPVPASVPDPVPDAGSALRDFKSLLESRRQAEDAMAASYTQRREASSHADNIVQHAEALAREIETDAYVRAEQIIADAQGRAALVEERAGRAVLRFEELAAQVQSAIELARRELGEALDASTAVTGGAVGPDPSPAAEPHLGGWRSVRRR